MQSDRPCRVSVRDADGCVHVVEVRAATLYEAAARASIFQRESWAAAALTPSAVLEAEVSLPTVSHQVPLAAVRKWMDGPTASPREQAIKQFLKRR